MEPTRTLAPVQTLAPLRSLLFVPGNRARMLEKARTLSADAVILDLEDAVPPGEKAAARATVRQALETGAYGPQVVLRVNALNTGLTTEDLSGGLVGGKVRGVCLPKAETAEDVERVASLLTTLEERQGWPVGGLSLLPLVETALGVVNAYEIARASHRVQALCLGGEDLTRDLGATRTREGLELTYARTRLVVAARAARTLAIDTVFTDLSDLDGLVADARQARQLGYDGKLLIHPAQIEPVHRAFAPSEEEVRHARRVLEAFRAAEAQGQGVITLDGQMVDAPVVARARQILAVIGE